MTLHPTDQRGAPGFNTGHGHVFPRPDGARARCGGPALCRTCATDATFKELLEPNLKPRVVSWSRGNWWARIDGKWSYHPSWRQAVDQALAASKP